MPLVGDHQRDSTAKKNGHGVNHASLVLAADGLTIKDLPLPQNCIISGILRHGEMVLPRGITALEEGDEILALVDEPARIELARLLGRRNGA